MTDPSEFFHQVETIFQSILETPAPLQTTVLESLCQGNEELLKEVRSLLKACEQEELATASAQLEAGNKLAAWSSRRRIGPYELDRLIGHGGMGAVYLARRADGQFDQQVAIKLMDLPFVTALFQEHFRQERQILARLSHPNIARMLDGGVSEEGELYLVIEYVNGLSIQEYCARHSLSIRARLQLFKSVCAGVRFAHQNLVVHRDLKPDNIIVLEDGTPKLLDFGTAKLLAPMDAAAESEFTRHGLRAFTPQYASPEQVLGHSISTATDIYSLGVLLYLLLTGAPPYELKSGTTDEMIRVICEQEPARPSAKAVKGTVDSDLDAIVLKALRKEPQERYSSVDQFVADLQAYLDGRPVAAHQGSLRYFAGKFVRRNRRAIVAAALLGASILAGMGGILWQARIANAERRMANARTEDLRALSNRLLSDINEAIQKLPGSTPAQKLIVSTVLEHLDRTAKDASDDPQTELDLANAYTRLGNVQGNPYDQNIGDMPGALSSLEKAISIATELIRRDPQSAAAAHTLALAQQSRSEVLFGVGRTPEAVAMMRIAASAYEALASRPGAKIEDLFQAAAAYGGLGDELGQNGLASLSNPAAAMAAFQKSLEIDERILRSNPSFIRARRGVAVNHMKIANIRAETDPGAALTDYRAAIEGIAALPADDRRTFPYRRIEANILSKMGLALKNIGKFKDALSCMEQAKAILKPFLAADPNDVRAGNDLLAVMENEAECYEDRQEGFFTEEKIGRESSGALQALSEARQLSEHLLQTQPDNAFWESTLGLLLIRISLQQSEGRKSSEAMKMAAEGVAILKEIGKRQDAQSVDLDAAATGLTIVEPRQYRDPVLAIKFAERMVANSHHQKPKYLLTLAHAYNVAGQHEKAHAVAKEGLSLLPGPTGNAVPSHIRKQLQAELSE